MPSCYVFILFGLRYFRCSCRNVYDEEERERERDRKKKKEKKEMLIILISSLSFLRLFDMQQFRFSYFVVVVFVASFWYVASWRKRLWVNYKRSDDENGANLIKFVRSNKNCLHKLRNMHNRPSDYVQCSV